jgi:hypothetical protein
MGYTPRQKSGDCLVKLRGGRRRGQRREQSLPCRRLAETLLLLLEHLHDPPNPAPCLSCLRLQPSPRLLLLLLRLHLYLGLLVLQRLQASVELRPIDSIAELRWRHGE